ncbi:DNA pilot protein [Dipodfec virus UOA04_Rod_535]|nr:DNA pilot protein [Dipodfec virus UOA04_Rod_535]
MPSSPSFFRDESRNYYYLNQKRSFMDPLSIGSAVASAGSSLFNIFTQNSRNKANAREQRLENERNRNFQREMAELAYQRNLEQWTRENEYNDPSNVRARLKSAGLNPDLIYGQGAGNMVSADSPQMSGSGYGSGGVTPTNQPISEFSALALERQRAEIDNIKANTRKTESEADIYESDASFRDAWNQGQLDGLYSNIRVNNSQVELNDSSAARLRKEFEVLDHNIGLIDSQRDKFIADAGLVDEQTRIASIERTYKAQHIESEIRALAAKANLDYATANEIYTLLSARAMNISADTMSKITGANLNVKNARISDIQGDRLEIDLALDENTNIREYERMAACYGSISQAAYTTSARAGDIVLGNKKPASSYQAKERSKHRK